MKESVVERKSFEYALKVIAVYKEMTKMNEYVLSKQLLRSGTSIGANVTEARAAISKKDFINKMSIAAKEARESKYWIDLLSQGQMVDIDFMPLSAQCEELIRILTSIVKSSQISI